MKKIRIGNDIRLRFKLKNTTEETAKDVKHIFCYIVKNLKTCHKCTEYALNVCENNQYHTMPVNVHNIYDKYLAYHTIDGINVSCYFPAFRQHSLGVYKLIVTMITDEEGWGKHDLRTYTFDYGDVFELVCTDGQDGDILIDIEDDPVVPPTPDEPAVITYQVGYSVANSLEEFINTKPLIMKEYEWESGKKQSIYNPAEEGIEAYIWVITTKPVTQIMGQMLQLPYEKMGEYQNRYYYKSDLAMSSGNDYIEIIF